MRFPVREQEGHEGGFWGKGLPSTPQPGHPRARPIEAGSRASGRGPGLPQQAASAQGLASDCGRCRDGSWREWRSDGVGEAGVPGGS